MPAKKKKRVHHRHSVKHVKHHKQHIHWGILITGILIFLFIIISVK